MNPDPTFLNFTCAQYRMRNLAWWVQIMCTGLVASLVTDRHTITLRLKIYYIEWWNRKISNDHWLLDSAMCAAPFDSFAMKWSCTLDPSEMLLPQQLVGHKSGAADSSQSVRALKTPWGTHLLPTKLTLWLEKSFYKYRYSLQYDRSVQHRVVVGDTLVFYLNEYFIELNQAKLKILNEFLNWIFWKKR